MNFREKNFRYFNKLGSGVACALFSVTVLFGCSSPSKPPPDNAAASKVVQVPDTLSFPYLNEAERRYPGYRELAERLAGSYVRIVLHIKREKTFRPDEEIADTSIHNGSGVVLDRRGHILTVAHIAKGKKFVAEITLRDGRQVRGRVVAISPREELALIKIPPLPGLEPANLGEASSIRKGALAIAIGSPEGQWGVATVGRIRVADIGERLDYNQWGFDNAIEIAMKVEIGHSGGPVFNENGQLIGLVAGFELGPAGKTGPPPRITYAVPIGNIRAWLAPRLPTVLEKETVIR